MSSAITRAFTIMRPRMSIAGRRNSSIYSSLYQNVWKKSTVNYITYVLVGCVVVEVVYGYATTSLWESYNAGKLYKQIDWSKFKSEDDEDEEGEEE